MTEEVKENVEQEQLVVSSQDYLKEVLDKFNANQEDPTLNNAEKVLLGKIKTAQQGVTELTKQVDELNEEIRERQEKGSGLLQQLAHLQGQSQGCIDSLLELR